MYLRTYSRAPNEKHLTGSGCNECLPDVVYRWGIVMKRAEFVRRQTTSNKGARSSTRVCGQSPARVAPNTHKIHRGFL